VCVLCELRVENLLLIERAELALAPGLNVLTGETGAGKTVLAHALDLLMGGRARSGIVRPGAQEAYVEGVFALGPGLVQELARCMPENARLDDVNLENASLQAPSLDDARESTVVLARRVGPDGRTRAYVNGRSASVSDLRALGARLISFYGQHEHRKLMLADAQLEILDRVCGEAHRRRLLQCAAAHAELRGLEAERERLGQLALARDRELDLLEHEISEIEQAAPDEAEHDQLLERRERLRRIDGLRAASGGAAEALSGELSEGLGAVQLIASASSQLGALAGVDRTLDALGERCQALAIEAQEVAGELRGYHEGLEGQEGSLQEVEELLALLERLMRKHGGTVASVLGHLQAARSRREELTGALVAQAEIEERLTQARTALQGHVAKLRAERRRAARKLEKEVRAQLGALAMGDATFEVSLAETPPRASGGDEVQFTIAPNPGVPPAPLREIASGGELSRLMLALATVSAVGGGGDSGDATGVASGAAEAAARAGSDSTLVFDEIDAGIGGHTARAVGERLCDLARGRQVLCITHLPQIASLADRHFSLAKQRVGDGTVTSVAQLGESELVSELVRMLGADEQDAGAQEHARQLLRIAA
jgi:DNA repair protein RecN (Recombination protein N)